jgi:hypothetical protein
VINFANGRFVTRINLRENELFLQFEKVEGSFSRALCGFFGGIVTALRADFARKYAARSWAAARESCSVLDFSKCIFRFWREEFLEVIIRSPQQDFDFR